MKVTSTKAAFVPVEIKIVLENVDELRALRRLFGGLPHADLSRAVKGSNVKGPDDDVNVVAALSTRLYDITRDLYKKEIV